MAEPTSPSGPSTAGLEKLAGQVLLAATAPLVAAVFLFLTGSEWKPALLGLGLLVTVFGLIAFEEALRDRGERLLPRFGTVAFAIGVTCFLIHDALGQAGRFVFEFERIYTVLACVTIGLFGWSILRSKALSPTIGWFAIAWGLAFGVLYVARIWTPPLGPNLATLLFGLALVRRT
jgi:hypothetical protein